MKITNFRGYGRTGMSALDWRFHAKVDVTTRRWFRDVTVTRPVHRKYGGSWFFADTGEFCPGFEVENMERAMDAQRSMAGMPCWKADALDPHQ